MAKIIVSYDGTDNDRDALALGRLLAGGGNSLCLAYVRHSAEPERSLEELAQHEAEKLLEAGAHLLGQDVPRFVVLSPSTPEGLRDLAVTEQADVVVFGSEYRTAPGHVDPQMSARRLLEGGPLAVALAPANLHDQQSVGIEKVAAVSENGDPSARETAESIARAFGASIAERPGSDVDLLVVGSRPGGANGRVMLSAAAAYLIETVRCSVLAVPRGTTVRFDAPATVHGGLAVSSIPEPG
jgi:nucleotide-binding universal stress UspA family protein